MINYLDPRWIFIPAVPPAAGFWLNLSTIRMAGDVSTEKQVFIKLWFIDGNTLLISGEQANSFTEQMQDKLGQNYSPKYTTA